MSYISDFMSNITNGTASSETLIEQAFGSEGSHTTMVSGRNKDTATGRFLRNQVDKKILANNKIVNGFDDPSFLAFTFAIKPTLGMGLFGNIHSMGNFDQTGNILADNTYSALEYLKQCRDAAKKVNATQEGKVFDTREESLNVAVRNMEDFTEGFYSICTEHPYTFQTIEGLPEVYKNYYRNNEDPYMGGKDNKIKIDCLESVDMRMFMLFDSYLRSVYNREYRRMNVPTNLIRFDCYVIVHDIRNFRLDEKNYKNNASAYNIAQHMSVVVFEFKRCVFDPEELGDTFSGVSAIENTMTKFSFSFTYGDVEIHSGSLADFLETDVNKFTTRLDNMTSAYDQTETLDNTKMNSELDDKPFTTFPLGQRNVYDQYNTNSTSLLALGEQMYNRLTSSTKFGNVYDDSKYALISNMLSTVNNVDTGTIFTNLAYRGEQAVKSKVNGILDGWRDNIRTMHDKK